MKMKFFILGKDLQDKENSDKLSEFYYKILFLLLASIPDNFFPISSHASCATYEPHHSLIIFFLSVHVLAPLTVPNASYLTLFLHVVSCHQINPPICERFTPSPIFPVISENHFLLKIFRLTPLTINTIYSFIY